MATAPKSEQPEMVLGRSAAAFMERAAEDAEASAPTDHFLARLQRAEARDAASPTGGGHRSAAVTDPRYSRPPLRAPASQGHGRPPSQLILPISAYEHTAAYRQQVVQHTPPEAVHAARSIAQHYGPLPGAQRELISRNMRRHFQPLHSQVDLSQPGAPEASSSLKGRLAYPVKLPNGEDPRAGKGGKPEDRPAGGRGNLAGPVGAHGTALNHHVVGRF